MDINFKVLKIDWEEDKKTLLLRELVQAKTTTKEEILGNNTLRVTIDSTSTKYSTVKPTDVIKATLPV